MFETVNYTGVSWFAFPWNTVHLPQHRSTLWETFVTMRDRESLDWQRIADELNRWKARTGGTWKHLADEAALSNRTVTKVANVEDDTVSLGSLRRISLAMGYSADMLERVGRGEDPPRASLDERVAHLEQMVAQIVRVLPDLTDDGPPSR